MARLARLTLTWNISNGTEKAMTTCHWLSPTGASLDSFRSAVDGSSAAWWTSLRAAVPSTVSIVSVRVDEIDISTGHVVAGLDCAVPTPAAGGISISSQAPAEVSPCLSLRTAFSGGSQRGRMYLPPVAVNQMDTVGNLSTTARNALTDAMALLFNAIVGGGTDWVVGVYSRKGHSFSPLVAIDMGTILDVQRSRRRSLIEQRYRVTIA